MGKIVSLKKNVDFRRLYKRGKSAVSQTLVVYAMPNRNKVNRLGLTAGKKVGCAVKRNRAKRRARALFQNYVLTNWSIIDVPKIDLFGRTYDFVIVLRAAAVNASPEKIKDDFDRVMKNVMKQMNR